MTIDTAQVTVTNAYNATVKFIWQYVECYQCLYYDGAVLDPDASWTWSASSRYGSQYAFVGADDQVENYTAYCSSTENLNENWLYNLTLRKAAGGEAVCDFAVAQTAPNSNLPVYIALLIAAALSVLWGIYRSHEQQIIGALRDRWQRVRYEQLTETDLPSQRNVNQNPLENSNATASNAGGGASRSGSRSRLNSLDSFRGLALCLMIFVNYGGGSYAYFNHIDWNGVTFADLVFPGFVFIMGVTMSLTLRRNLRPNVPPNSEQVSGTSAGQRLLLLLRAARRSATLFLLGFSLSNVGAAPENWRIFGVLNRLGLTYLLTSAISLLRLDTYPSVLDPKKADMFRLPALRDLYPFWLEWLVVTYIAGFYLALTFALPVPGCPTGYLGAGGLADRGANVLCTGGAAGYIDRYLFTDPHLYQSPTCRDLYQTSAPYDPEGLLGTLTSTLLCYLGLQVGKIMFAYRDNLRGVYLRWLMWATVTGALAFGLCAGEMNGGLIPLNKNLWSFSYILAMASISTLVFALFFFLIDHARVWHGEPFTFIGQNSILIYFAHEAFEAYFPITFGWNLQTHAELLAMNIYSVTFWMIVSYVLYRKRVFLTI